MRRSLTETLRIGTAASLFVLPLAIGGARADSLHGGPSPQPNYTDLSDYLLQQNDARRDGGGHDRGRTPPPGSGYNFSVVEQYGSYINVTADLDGHRNRSAQLQYGLGNSSSIDVTGANNNVGTLQIGSGNNVDLSVNGQNNTILQTQIGNNLSYSLNQTGNGKSISVHQFGSK